jgi:VWFA-related protein
MRLRPQSTRVLTALLVTASSAVGHAQSQTGADTPSSVFHTRTDLVSLDVSVESSNDEAVPTLRDADFLIIDDNAPQTVAFFAAAGRLPIAVALLVDHSQSMAGERLDRAKTAASAFVRRLEPDDLVEVLAFNDATTCLYPLGSDRDLAGQAVAELTASGPTALYDALLIALRDLANIPGQRAADYQKVVVILTDGEDTASRDAFEEVLDEARRNSTAIDGISLRTDKRDRWLAPVHELAQLAFDTGGRTVAVRRVADLYVPTPPSNDGRWHQVSVRTTNKALIVRTRAGYYAPSRPE